MADCRALSVLIFWATHHKKHTCRFCDADETVPVIPEGNSLTAFVAKLEDSMLLGRELSELVITFPSGCSLVLFAGDCFNSLGT